MFHYHYFRLSGVEEREEQEKKRTCNKMIGVIFFLSFFSFLFYYLIFQFKGFSMTLNSNKNCLERQKKNLNKFFAFFFQIVNSLVALDLFEFY